MGLGNLLMIPGLGANTLDIRARVGVSSSPTSTGSQTITGIGFQPKAVIPFGAGMTVDGATTTIIKSFGAITGNANASVSVRSQNAVTTSATARHHNATNAISYIDGTLAATNILASRQSLDANGFTLNYSAVDVVARISNHICLGGADLEVSLTQHQMNSTNLPQSFAHGLSGPPTGLLLFSAHDSNAPPVTNAVAAMCIGVWSSAGGFAANFWSASSVTTSETRRILSNQAVMQFNTILSHSLIRSMAVSSVDATNVNVTYPITTSTGQAYFWMLAIRGAKCQTGTFDCNGSTSPLTIPCPGMSPRLFLPVFIPVGVDQVGIIQNSVAMTVGASDGVNTVSCGLTDSNGLTTTNARRYQASAALEEYFIFSGLKAFEAQCSFSGQSVVISPLVNTDPNFGQGAYLIIGA